MAIGGDDAPAKPAVTSDAPDDDVAGSTDNLFIASIRSSEDEALLRYAESVIVSRCMGLRGFTYVPYGLEAQRSFLAAASRAAELSAFPYDAEREGAPYADSGEAQSGDANVEHILALDEPERIAYGDALQGFIENRLSVTALGVTLETPKEGCVSEARSELYGDLDSALTVLLVSSNLGSQAHASTRSAARVQTALEAWKQCMKMSGYVFDDFSQARQAGRGTTADVAAIAATDARCTDDSQLGEAYRSAYASALESIVEANAGQFETLYQVRQTAVRRATEIAG